MNTIEEITKYSKYLRLPGIKGNLKRIANEARESEMNYEEFLRTLLEEEYEIRKQNAIQSRIRTAKFPQRKYLEDLKEEYLPKDAQNKLEKLKTLEFIKTGQNIILSGNPGTGKSHIAISLGIKACVEGYKVLFFSVPTLITKLKESRSEKILRIFQSRLEKYDLIIVDELGYISFDKEGSELLFTSLSLRANNKSTIITTNLSFDRWEEVFKDPVLTAAMVDRLAHKAFMVNMNGNSFRIKETQDWLDSQGFS